MENQNPSNEIDSSKKVTRSQSDSLDKNEPASEVKKELNTLDKPEKSSSLNSGVPANPKKPAKPPKLEDKPFKEFISNFLIPVLKASIEDKGTVVCEIKLIEGKRPVVGGNCWMVYCELSEQRKFWLCFNKDIITSDKTILLAESNSCLLYTSPSPRDKRQSRMPSSA